LIPHTGKTAPESVTSPVTAVFLFANLPVEADVLSAPFNLPVIISEIELEEVLGPMKYKRNGVKSALAVMKPGMCFGLAWTPLGGEVLVIETSISPGKGRVQLTGKLGEVLRESVGVALSWLKAHSEQLAFAVDFFNKNDVHVHLPSGGVGKDGPSAGCALVVALASLATGRLANRNTAVTGEVTLSGAVLPVGGIKEKLMAARRDGFHRVILPADNMRHTKELDLGDLKVLFVSNVDQLLKYMLDDDGQGLRTREGLLSKL